MRPYVQMLVQFLAILNPFALCLYLIGVMEDLGWKDFIRVIAGAGLVSVVVFGVCAVAGEFLMVDLLHVRPEGLRVFGGIIFLIVAYNYVSKGYRAAVQLRGSLEELHSVIALPFMIGAGTITQSILVGKHLGPIGGVSVLAIGVVIALLVVLGFKAFRDRMRGKREALFDRYVNIIARVNGLLIGAISAEMVVSGTRELWMSGA